MYRVAPSALPADDAPDKSSRDSILAQRAKRGVPDAFDTLFRIYRPRIFALARRFFAPGADRDDLLQEATIGFFKAVRDYNSDCGSFSVFADLCVRRQVITFIKSATRRKHDTLNRAISLDAPVFDDSNETLVARLSAPEAPHSDPTHSTFLDALWSRCSDLERGVLSLYTSGYSFSEMATELGVHLKSIDNAVWRVKVKAKKLLLEQPVEL